MTVSEGAGSAWAVSCTAAFTDEDIACVTRVARAPRELAGSRLFWSAVGVAVVSAVLAIAFGVVPERRGAAAAAGSLLVCMAGMWLHYGDAMRASRRRAWSLWSEFKAPHTVVLDQAGIAYRFRERSGHLSWSCARTAWSQSGLIFIQTNIGGYVVVPARCLPADWPVDRLLSVVKEAIAQPQADAGTA